MEKPKLIFLGGGGHALSCWDVAHASQQWNIIGYTDQQKKEMPIPYLGLDEEVNGLISNADVFFFLGIGHLGNPLLRHKIAHEFNRKHAKWATLISPNAYVSPLATVEEGSIIHHRVVLNAGVSIGKHAIINTGATIEHGSFVGEQTHISTHVILNGDVHIGNDCFIGSGCVGYQQIRIQSGTTIAAGSILRKSIHSAGIYGGNPLRKIA